MDILIFNSYLGLMQDIAYKLRGDELGLFEGQGAG
jgi:hypothetical protein